MTGAEDERVVDELVRRYRPPAPGPRWRCWLRLGHCDHFAGVAGRRVRVHGTFREYADQVEYSCCRCGRRLRGWGLWGRA